jgi:hypothetical protein
MGFIESILSKFNVGWTWYFKWTGYTKEEPMAIKDPVLLAHAQDDVFANKAYWPVDNETFCNLATQDVLHQMEYEEMQGMTADQMYEFISKSKDWLIKPMADAQELVNSGTILVAILPASKLGQSHGHVNTLTPGVSDFSGHWNCKAPSCMNLGRVGTCFRNQGENWAFQVIPEIYALVETL